MEPLFRRRPGWLLLWLGVLVCATPSAGQPQSRTEEIQSARQQKAARLQPEKTSGWVKRLMKFSEPGALESFLQTGEGGDGFQPLAFGGVRSGHGWSVGIGYAQRNLAGGRVRFSSKARVTLAKAYLFDVKLVLPRLVHNRHFLEFQARHENSPRMDYYGRGPDSIRSQRTSYRLEDTGLDITTGVKPIRRLRLGVTGGYYAVNTGRGQRPRFPRPKRSSARKPHPESTTRQASCAPAPSPSLTGATSRAGRKTAATTWRAWFPTVTGSWTGTTSAVWRWRQVSTSRI